MEGKGKQLNINEVIWKERANNSTNPEQPFFQRCIVATFSLHSPPEILATHCTMISSFLQWVGRRVKD